MGRHSIDYEPERVDGPPSVGQQMSSPRAPEHRIESAMGSDAMPAFAMEAGSMPLSTPDGSLGSRDASIAPPGGPMDPGVPGAPDTPDVPAGPDYPGTPEPAPGIPSEPPPVAPDEPGDGSVPAPGTWRTAGEGVF